MKRRRIVFADQARADLAQIEAHIAAGSSPPIAEAFVERILTAIGQLSDAAEVGVLEPSLGQGRRRLVVRPYLIGYVVHDDKVDVLRVVHGARNLTDLFGEG